MCNKTKHTCGDPNYATCVTYEKELPDFTKITDNCYTIEETTEDQYLILGDIKEEIDLSELGEQCLSYVLDENDKIVVKNVLLKYEEKICEMETKITELENRQLCDMLIGDCVNVSCLTSSCDEPITTFGELLQSLIDKSCE